MPLREEAKERPDTQDTGTTESHILFQGDSTMRTMMPISAKTSATRPSMLRAATTAAAVRAISAGESTPLLSRPILNRSATTTGVPIRPSLSRSLTAPTPARPSLLRRATDLLDLNGTTSYTSRNAPSAPSHWTDHAHRNGLVSIWDAVHAAAARSKYARSIVSRVVSTEKQMLQEFAELGQGDAPLTRDWIEYVLGICLRQPFCTAERMGRFEVLAASAGVRANWGPW